MKRIGTFALLPILASCSGEQEKRVTAWPGMSVAGFNRLNPAASLKPTGTDWIGINSPVTLVFRQGEASLSFSGTRRGGGIQILSSDLSAEGRSKGQARIETIAFNIGGGLEDLAARGPELAGQCDRLARMTKAKAAPVPDAATLAGKLEAAGGGLVEVCGGTGARMRFQITAMRDDRKSPGDHGRAYLDGSLSLSDR